MSVLQILSIVLVLAGFGVAIWRHVNVGLVILPAAFVLSLLAGMDTKTLFAGFPASLVVLLLGVTYLFGHVTRSGGINRIVHGAEALVGHRDYLLPGVAFLLAAFISALGALPAAALGVVLPIAIDAAERKRIDLMAMAVVTILGALAGGFSPISVWGVLIRSLAADASYDLSLGTFFVVEFVLLLVLAIVAFVFYRGWQKVPLETPSGRSSSTAYDPSAPPPGSTSPGRHADKESAGTFGYEFCSFLALGLFAVAVLFFGLNVGLCAFLFGAVLHLVFKPDSKAVIADLPWGAVLIVAGVLTYIGVMEHLGTLAAISQHLSAIGTPFLSILALTYFAAVFASFESSSVAVIGVVLPVALEVLHLSHGSDMFLPVVAVCFSIVIMSTSPYHLSGALAISNVSSAHQADVLFRRLLWWTLGTTAIAPALVSLVTYL